MPFGWGGKFLFFYFDLSETGSRVYRKEKSRYRVEPIALMIQNEKYYLLTFYDKYQEVVTYRLDRMESVIVEPEPISSRAGEKSKDLSRYSGAVYNMFSGKEKKIRLRFWDGLIGVIFDQYGEDIPIKRIDEKTCQCDIQVEISPTFWGWLFQFADNMEIVRPREVRDEYLERCKKVLAENEKSHDKHDFHS